MVTGKELILATKPYAKEIRWKSWVYTLSTLFLLVLSLSSTLYFHNVFLKLFFSVFSGLLMVRMFVIYHDYLHHSILYKSLPARVLFSVFGVFILAPASIWKRSHDHHHNHNSKLFSASIGSYPIMTSDKFMKASEKERLGYLAIRHPLTIALGYFSMFLYGICIQSFTKSFVRHWDSLLAFVLHVSVAIFLLTKVSLLGWLMMWFLPFFIADMIGSYLFYAQHNFPAVQFKNNVEWNYFDAALKSSSYMVMNPFWRWITANIGYHHIHHINSRIPFYRLPEVMDQIPQLQHASRTSLRFSEIIACLRLKVWDENLNRMISLSELESKRTQPVVGTAQS